ncbi:MAG TPA: ShlB/FhaC/HecB family hemolysin secretion/activation protein [Sphingobium sp.]|nr:ShlB/FhaC/HecB family hemolysin secretion/activation protein [Sphingobium sp.]
MALPWTHGGAAHAQASPAQSAAPTREELRPVTEPERQAPPRLSVTGDIERSPCPLADPRFAGVHVYVNNVTYNNLKGATVAEMRAAWAPFAGTKQPVAVLCEIRDAAATILRNKGYLAAVQVPTQRIENGEIRMEMLYARVTAVRARGETQGAEALIARYLGRLAEDEIFDRNQAERYLLLARDIPGYNVQLTLKPAGTGPGEMIGEVTVVRQPYVVDMSIQNLSSRAVGRWGGQVRARAFGLTGMGDATSLSFYSTADFEEQQILQASHEFRLGGEGLRIAAQFTYAWTEPDIGAGALPDPLRARTLFATLEAGYPLVRSQAHNLSVAGGLDFVNQRVDFGAPLSRDRLRVLFARISGDAVDLSRQLPRWRLSGHVELRKGLSIFDALDCASGCAAGLGPSRLDALATAALVRAAGVAEIALGNALGLAIAPRMQIAFDPVAAFEEFSAGNFSIGRGFDPGVISGDSGIGASVELRGPGVPIGSGQGLSLRPYVFADGARIWNLNGAAPATGLLSLGGGARAALSDRLALDANVAVPTAVPRDAAGVRASRSVRFLMTLTARLLPWSDR